MDLLEYQAKELFKEVGIPTLPSQQIKEIRDLKQLHIPYPVVLKSQVRVGGRGRAGGVRFVENTIDAIAAARTIFNLPIMGQYPQVLLAESRYDAQMEFFLAVVLDYHLQRPVLLGSSAGGIHIELLLEKMQKVVVEDEFSPFYARRLAIAMGLKGILIQSVSSIIEKMYHLFEQKDLDLIEINPLGVSAKGEVMALDGKISVNDNALKRQLEIFSLISPSDDNKDFPTEINQNFPSVSSGEITPQPQKLDWQDESGKIAIICNNMSLGVSTGDLLIKNQYKVNCCWVVGENRQSNLVPSSFLKEQLQQVIHRLIKNPSLQVIFINILSSPNVSTLIAKTLGEYFTPPKIPNANPLDKPPKPDPSQHFPQIIVRVFGGQLKPYQEYLINLPILWTEDIEEAVKLISITE
jgi:succinyl-CoA synthetase beta subunit